MLNKENLNKMRNHILTIAIIFGLLPLSAQMVDNGVTRFGNEWINYGKSYIKISVEKTGIHRISYDDLLSLGMPSDISGSQFQLINNGEEVALMTTTESNWSSGDYFLFFGEKNDGDADKYHYRDWTTDQLNPKQSLYSDIRSYYLSWTDASVQNLRYEEVENDLSGSLPAKKEFYMHKEEKVFGSKHWGPLPPDVPQIKFSSFLRTEGFGNEIVPEHILNFSPTNVFDAPVQPRVEARVGGNSSASHIIEVSVNDLLLDVDEFSGARIRDYSLSFDNRELKSNTQLKLSGKAIADLFIVGHASLVYPREFNASDKSTFSFEQEGNSFNDYYEIEDFAAGTQNIVFDIENKRFINAIVENGVAKFFLPQGGELRSTYYLGSDESFTEPSNMSAISFNFYDDMNPEYLIITSEALNPSDNPNNAVQQYAQFRRSALGKEFKTEVINIEEIIDQFGFGIKGNAYAIRNFSQYMKDKWPDFKLVFIIGKALDYSLKNRQTNIVSQVPTFGNPGSDNLMFSDQGLTYPNVGTGRLAAQTEEDVLNYLDKIKAHAELVNVENKTIEERIWRKDVIHLSGGDAGNQEQLFQHLSSMEEILENGEFGANVFTFRKTSADPVQTAASQEILKKIDNGISMLTFFGHSSASTFDFSVEDPTKYKNEGKLPLILSMGCNSGDIHQTIESLSEQMILTKDVGAIAFVASSGSAFPSPLAVLGKDFYDKLADDFYGQPIGTAIQKMQIDLYSPDQTKVRTLHEQNTLHGDPALSLFYADAPDYVVDFSSISTGGEVGTNDDKINISFDIVNLGRGVRDSIDNMLVHEYGDGQSDTVYFKTVAPTNREFVELNLDNPGPRSLGKNTINIVLDIKNAVAESPNPQAEENNDLKRAYANEGYCFFIFDNSAFPIYPRDFAIVNKQNITLKASANNAFAPKQSYTIQIDTTELFDSPFLKAGEVTSSPGLIQWNPEIQFEDEVVYYWRISLSDMSEAIWNGSSFVYLDDSSEGWNQSHLYQWQKDDYTNYAYSEETRQFVFAENINDVKIETGVYPNQTPKIIIRNESSEYLPFLGDGEIPSGLMIAVLDKDTGIPWRNDPNQGGLYGSDLHQPWAQQYEQFPFRTNNVTNRRNVIDFIDDVVPDGSYVALYTLQRADINQFGSYRASQWPEDATINTDGKDIMSVLESHGATRVRELLEEEVPYVFIFRKNDPSFEPVEVLAETTTVSLEVDFNVIGRWFEGDVTSTVIGPAAEWNRLEWTLDSNVDEDEFRLDIYGIKANGDEELLFPNIEDFDFDLSFVNSNIYPNLRLMFYSKDETKRTSAQMGYWRVLYKEKPEAVLHLDEKYVFESDTLFLGEQLKFSTVATNITTSDMDSLLVKFSITDEANQVTNVFKYLEPLKGEGTIDIDFEYDTDQLLGLHRFAVEINPEMAQPEQFLFNNIGVRDFVVQGDKINPILDVTFDGLQIMDGDIVSPRPHIRVDLKDENEYLFINDINSFDLALQKEPDNQSFPVDLSGANIAFTPADSTSGNVAHLDFYPELESGEYILYVQAKDVSGNLSGDQDIEVRFVVVEESQVSNVLNYPNPFSTSTQFVFTLTGFEVPEIFTIQIMTMTGKVVREITREELGNLRIGVNRTDFKWDGTDEYGSKLANGVYLYRVLTSQGGEKLDQFYNEDIDGFFKEGFGKLVIMR